MTSCKRRGGGSTFYDKGVGGGGHVVHDIMFREKTEKQNKEERK